jgi:hypothetical protein
LKESTWFQLLNLKRDFPVSKFQFKFDLNHYTKDEGQEPFTYQAGVGGVIAGWDQGGTLHVESS